MRLLSDADEADLLLVLAQMRKLVVPQCAHAGEELAFVARRDNLIDRAVAIIIAKGKPSAAASPSPTTRPETISVNQQELANTMIQNTFDQYKDLLRKRLHDMEAEAARWKQMAQEREAVRPLGGGDVAERATQTPHTMEETLAVTALTAQREWVSRVLVLCDDGHCKKADAVAEAFRGAAQEALWHLAQQQGQCPNPSSSSSGQRARVGTEAEAAENAEDMSRRAPPVESRRSTRAEAEAKGPSGAKRRGGAADKKAATSSASSGQLLPRHKAKHATLMTDGAAALSEKQREPTNARAAAAPAQAPDENMLYAISSLTLATRGPPPTASRSSLPIITHGKKKFA